jgi:hypothetical protein
MFSSADLLLAAGKMRENQLVTGGFRHWYFTESQAAYCKHFQCQNRRFVSLKRVIGRIFKISK